MCAGAIIGLRCSGILWDYEQVSARICGNLGLTDNMIAKAVLIANQTDLKTSDVEVHNPYPPA
jgi:hypothetical protein